ncbi:MAG: MCE family protein [Cytophagia bacterium]|nr:MAG: MCE family protein [Runella sp.]TAG17405.1 MAG: MCE family protein [Cytophagales bacterium]TAG39023.1 MAG: MCE family protein [Cytophagia bacterium]TAG79311.1 MAG: MCE family protein [Cytophagales bacterium]
MNISREAKVGLLGVVSLTMLYFGFNFLKGSDWFSSTTRYYALFDNVGGLQPSNAIKLNGVQVGRVNSTVLMQERGNMVLVELDINNNIVLRQGVKAVLSSELLGGSAIILQMPQTGNSLPEGDTISSAKESGIQALLQEKALPVLQSVDSLASSLNKVVKQFDKTGFALNKLLATADQTAAGVNGVVAANSVSIAATMANLKLLSASLVETEKGLKPLMGSMQATMGNLQTTTDSLKALRLGQTLNQANRAVTSLQQTLAKLEKGEGTAGKLLKDETLYENINRTIVSVNKLMTNFRQYPKRYVSVSVFGRKDKGPADSPADTTSKF